MDAFFNVLAGLIPLIGVLNSLGLVVKYVPVKFLGFVSNELIPYLNTLVAFFAAFGGPAQAHAGIFGDIGHALSLPAKIGASIFVSILARQTFEAYIRPLANAVGLKKN